MPEIVWSSNEKAKETRWDCLEESVQEQQGRDDDKEMQENVEKHLKMFNFV